MYCRLAVCRPFTQNTSPFTTGHILCVQKDPESETVKLHTSWPCEWDHKNSLDLSVASDSLWMSNQWTPNSQPFQRDSITLALALRLSLSPLTCLLVRLRKAFIIMSLTLRHLSCTTVLTAVLKFCFPSNSSFDHLLTFLIQLVLLLKLPLQRLLSVWTSYWKHTVCSYITTVFSSPSLSFPLSSFVFYS